MSLRGLAVAAILLAALVLAWQKRDGLQALFRQAQGEAVAGARSATQPASGGMRKCVKGQQVTYTNAECPPGHQQQAVAGDVSVLPVPPVAKPAESSSAPSSLHQTLGLTPDAKLKERIMERAIEGAR